jgi:hypothetical protein
MVASAAAAVQVKLRELLGQRWRPEALAER